MADINDYIGDCKFDFTEQEKSLMDIFAGSWEHCHNSSCMDCEFNNGNEKFSVLLCMSYQYAKKLIDNGYKKVRHVKWNKNGNSRDCSICGFKYYANGGFFNFCPNCGAKME